MEALYHVGQRVMVDRKQSVYASGGIITIEPCAVGVIEVVNEFSYNVKFQITENISITLCVPEIALNHRV